MAFAHLGEDYNICAVASGVGIRIADFDAVGILATTSTTTSWTLTLSTGNTLAQAATFGYSQPTGWAPIVYYYTDSSNGAGTAVWSQKVANNATGDVFHGAGSNVVPYTGTIASGTSVFFTLLATQVPVGYNYLKVTASGGTGITMVIASPDVQRAPYNLPAMSS